MPDWSRIAHRGASGSAPEHTRAAFERALQIGVDMIELDVQLSRDGQLVVIHDEELARTTNGRGAVRDCDWESLRQLDAGAWFDPRFAGERLLRLDDVLDIVGGRAELNVEIKSPERDWNLLTESLLRLLRARDAVGSTVISCFATGALARVREHSRDVRLGVLWHDPDCAPVWPLARELRAHSFHPHWALASEALVRRAHADGLRVLTWTVNEPPLMGQLLRFGVDGIMSDHPERFVEARV